MACTPSSGAIGALRLVQMAPTDVPLHGGGVTLTFSGDLPSTPQYVRFNDQMVLVDEPTTSSTIVVTSPAGAAAGPIRVSLVTPPADGERELTWLDCAGQYVMTPAAPSLTSMVDTLAQPLHPELARSCARTGRTWLTNLGDAPLVAHPSIAGSPTFVFSFNTCDAGPLAFGAACYMAACFSAGSPGTYYATLDVATNVGPVGRALTATVLPATPGLDPSFAATGGVVLATRMLDAVYGPVVAGTTLASDGTTLVAWLAGTYGFTTVSTAGIATMHPLGSIQSTFSTEIRTMRAAPAGHGMYAVAGSGGNTPGALVHFADDGSRDLAFGGTGDVGLLDDAYYPGAALAVQASGRILVVGETSVRGFTPSGDLDATYGTAGVTSTSAFGTFTNTSVLDSQGRLYLGTSTGGLVRLTAGGAVDTGFAYAGAVQALAIDGSDHVFVAASGQVRRLDATGAATLVADAMIPSAVIDLAVDSQGRFYLTTSAGVAYRSGATGMFAPVGFVEGGARGVTCAASGACAIGGSTDVEAYVLALLP